MNNLILFIILLYYISFCLLDECPKFKPIKYNNECVARFCTEEEFENQICIILNEEAKIQRLNNLITFSNEDENLFVNLGINIYKNKILLTTFYSEEENKINIHLYNINNNKIELLNKLTNYNNNEFIYVCIGECNSKLLSLIININTNDYILLCYEYFCVLINYDNNDILLINSHNLSVPNYVFSGKNTLFKLNDNYHYFYGSINSMNNNNILVISKINFNYNQTYSKIINEEKLIDQRYISCFQTENNLIQCMIVNENEYLIILLFDYETLDLIQRINLDNKKDYFYEECIHLEKNIGIYYYFYDNEMPPLKIKDLVFNNFNNEYELIDIVNNSITIDVANEHGLQCEILKISNTRFLIFHIFDDNFLLVLCDLYGSNNYSKNLIIRYYKIPFDLYNLNDYFIYNCKGFLYEDFISFSMIRYDRYTQAGSPLIIIFGYNNNIEPDKILNINNINDNDSFNYIININDYLNNNIIISNNLFGYEFIGIKIISLTGISSGIKYYIKSNHNKEIKKNDILNINDEIIIDYSNAETKINNDFYLELAAIFGEAEYDKFNSFSDKIEIYGEEDQRNYFQKKTFVGNSLKVKYNFGCHKICDTCEYTGIKIDDQKCITCKHSEEYCYMNNENNCFDTKNLTYNYYNKIGKLICIPSQENCPNDYPFENKNTKECKESISFKDLVSEEYIITNNKETIDKVIKILKEQINNKNINNSEDTIIKGKNITFHLTSPEKQKEYIDNNLYENISSIDLNECENILKEFYQIKEPLIIMKVDIKRNDTRSTQVEYEVLNPENGDILDLSKCENIKINVYVPVVFDENTYDLIKHLKEQGYDIFNPNDTFYNDICTPYNSVNDTDIIIKDRRNDFYDPNLTLCESTCEYKGFDINTSKVNCECQTKTEINSDIDETSFSPNILFENFYSFDKYTNYKVMKCYNLAFNPEKLKKNIGSYITIFMFLCFVIVMSFHIASQYKNYDEKFNKVIYLNFLMEKKIERKKFDKKEVQNKIRNLTEPKDNDKINVNRIRLSFIDIDNINDLMSDKKYELQNDMNKLNNFEQKPKNIKDYSTIKSYYSECTLEEDPVNSIKCLHSIKSPIKMNNMNKKINHLETGSETVIENKNIISINNDNNDNNININININNLNIKKESNKDNNSLKSSFLLDFENNNKKYISRNKQFLKKNSFESKSSNRSITINSNNSNFKFVQSTNDIEINKNKNKNKNNKLQYKMSRSKTLNIKKETIQNIEQDKRISHILKNIPKKERSKYFIDNELNDLEFKYAVNIDFRSFFQYYWSLLKQTHPIIFTFITRDDYNLFFTKVGLFTLSFALTLTMNALFFSDDSMHKLYIDYGQFDFIYNLPQTIYSAILSGLLSFLIQYLSLSEDTLLKFKEDSINNDDIFIKKEKEIKCLIIKNIIFFIIGIILLLFFWYYLSCFCAVYYNTQIPLIKDTFISFGLGLLYPFPLTLIPTFVRIPALRKKSICLYKISRILTFAINLI